MLSVSYSGLDLHLYSFPTRRSSDLAVESRRGGTLVPADALQRYLAEIRRIPVLSRGSAGARRRDRKSTRLNSSHGYISYAVFCLKKKNTTTSSSTFVA